MTKTPITYLDTPSFETSVIQNSKTALVCFTATWCGPCKAMAPILQDIANEHGDAVDIFKVDIDEEPNIAIKLGIASVPTIIVFSAGQETKRSSGLLNKSRILGLFNNAPVPSSGS
jgi:thioredoxin 1